MCSKPQNMVYKRPNEIVHHTKKEMYFQNYNVKIFERDGHRNFVAIKIRRLFFVSLVYSSFLNIENNFGNLQCY